MKLCTYQENLLKKIPSVEERRVMRNVLKSLTKDIRKCEWMMEECMTVDYGNLPLELVPVWDYWEKLFKRKTERIKEIENSLKKNDS